MHVDLHRNSRILARGAAAFVGLFLLGALVMVPWVEDDLTERAERAAATAGYGRVTASFSGQDGILRCIFPVADPAGLERTVREIWGVRDIALHACGPAPGPAAGGSATSEPLADG